MTLQNLTAQWSTDHTSRTDPKLTLPKLPLSPATLRMPSHFVNAEEPRPQPEKEQSLYQKCKDDLKFTPGMKMEDAITLTLVTAAKKDPAFEKELLRMIRGKEGVDKVLKLMADNGFMIDSTAFDADNKLTRGRSAVIEVLGRNASPDTAALKAMFPDKKDNLGPLQIYYVRTPNSNIGHTQGALAAVDKEAAAKACKDLQTIMTEAAKASPQVQFAKIPPEKFLEAVEVNELAHLVLNTVYKWDASDKRDWSKVPSGLKGYKIPDSQNVHEFISDCASAMTPEGGIPLLYVKFITNRNHPGYAYAHAALEPHLEAICARHDTTLAKLKEKLPNTGEQIAFLLALTTPADVKAIQGSFTTQTKLLLEEITKGK